MSILVYASKDVIIRIRDNIEIHYTPTGYTFYKSFKFKFIPFVGTIDTETYLDSNLNSVPYAKLRMN